MCATYVRGADKGAMPALNSATAPVNLAAWTATLDAREVTRADVDAGARAGVAVGSTR